MPYGFRISLIPAALLFSVAGHAVAFAQNAGCKGIWISPEELAAIPASGAAWENLKSKADLPAGSPDLSNQEDPANVRVLAKALVYARTGVETYRSQVIAACMAAIGTEKLGRTLSLGRELAAYVIAADLVGLPADKDLAFRGWLRKSLTESLQGVTLVSTHERRPNNWGTHAGASRAAVAVYLGDAAELDRCARVFRGWLGDRSSYAGFSFGELGWQSDSASPVGINPKNARIAGHSVDGVLADDQRRSGGFSWPPAKENYVYEALQGALVQAVILHRAGYDVWNWQDRALLRAFDWLHAEAGFPATGDDTWQPHLINYHYGRSFPAPVPSSPGKNVGWTDWTHGSPSPIKTGVHGRVEDVALAAVAGVEVQLRAGQQVISSVRSNSGGCYRFVNVAPGTYELHCSSPGFVVGSRTVSVPAGQQLFGQNIQVLGRADSIPPAAPTNLRVTKEAAK